MTSPRSRPSSASGHPGDLGWMALVVFAAVIGGLAAVAIDHGRVPVLIDVVISVAIGGVIAFVSLRRLMAVAPDPGQPGLEQAQQPGSQHHEGQPQAGQARRPGELHDPVLMLPTTGRAGPSSPWWELAGKPLPGAPGEREALRPHELDKYADNAFIAQCPRCGAFELDAKQGPEQWKFGCYACDYRWPWRPGTAWPPVQVRPKLRAKTR